MRLSMLLSIYFSIGLYASLYTSLCVFLYVSIHLSIRLSIHLCPGTTAVNDIDECSLHRGNLCGQICVNTVGSYRCDCNPGFTLHTDGSTCIEDERTFRVTLFLIFYVAYCFLTLEPHN